tara:strand:+ start:1075 stop:1221 length:147 start_codon:yes stop_codon:yes gene_type:complete
MEKKKDYAPDTRLSHKGLYEFYQGLLDSGKILIGGGAYQRLKYFKERA